MSPDELNEYDLPVEIEGGDQSVVSAGNLKMGAHESRYLRQHGQHRLRPWWIEDRCGTNRVGGCHWRRHQLVATEAVLTPSSRTLLTVPTVSPKALRIVMILVPARPSRLKTISMPIVPGGRSARDAGDRQAHAGFLPIRCPSRCHREHPRHTTAKGLPRSQST
jgi:hypothetical protein